VTQPEKDDYSRELAELSEAPMFRGLSPRAIEDMFARGERCQFDGGEIILREDAPSPDLLVVLGGRLRVEKRHTDSDRDYFVAHIEAGGVVGELGLVRAAPELEPRATATVIAEGPVTLLRLPLESIEIESDLVLVRANLVLNAGRVLADKLARSNDAAVAQLRSMLDRQRLFTRYMVSVVGVFSLFSVSVYALVETERRLESLGLPEGAYRLIHAVTFTLLLFFGFWYCIHRSGLSLKSLGCTTSEWRKDVALGLAFSVPGIVGMAIMRIILYPDERWYVPFVFTRDASTSVPAELLALLFYLGPIVWTQEFITRIGMQAVIADMLPEEPRMGALVSIFVAAVGFGAFHTYYGLSAVLVTILAGLYWGLAFHIRRSLVMAGVLHMVCGFVAFYGFGLLRW
jgi:CRP-like cAMP-binding protein